MVVDMPPGHTVDNVFQALADATRRDILRRCLTDELSVTQLAREYPMSFAAVQKHVAVLERAGLVKKEKRGREQLVRTDETAIRLAHLALDMIEATWTDRVKRMAGLLAQHDDCASAESMEGKNE